MFTTTTKASITGAKNVWEKKEKRWKKGWKKFTWKSWVSKKKKEEAISVNKG